MGASLVYRQFCENVKILAFSGVSLFILRFAQFQVYLFVHYVMVKYRRFLALSLWRSVRRFDARLPFTMSVYRQGLKRGLRALSQRRRVRMACMMIYKRVLWWRGIGTWSCAAVACGAFCDGLGRAPRLFDMLGRAPGMSRTVLCLVYVRCVRLYGVICSML